MFIIYDRKKNSLGKSHTQLCSSYNELESKKIMVVAWTRWSDQQMYLKSQDRSLEKKSMKVGGRGSLKNHCESPSMILWMTSKLNIHRVKFKVYQREYPFIKPTKVWETSKYVRDQIVLGECRFLVYPE